jgi:hypothetical protein
VDAYFRFLRSRPAVWRLLFRDPPADPELVDVQRRLQAKRSRMLTSLLAREDSATRRGKKLSGELLTTAIRAYATWWFDHPRVPRERVVDAVLDFTEAGVKRLSD